MSYDGAAFTRVTQVTSQMSFRATFMTVPLCVILVPHVARSSTLLIYACRGYIHFGREYECILGDILDYINYIILILYVQDIDNKLHQLFSI